jgi:TonB family protein
MELICNGWVGVADSAQDAATRQTRIARYISARLTNRRAIEAFKALAYMDFAAKQRLLRSEADRAGLDGCTLARAMEKPDRAPGPNGTDVQGGSADAAQGARISAIGSGRASAGGNSEAPSPSALAGGSPDGGAPPRGRLPKASVVRVIAQHEGETRLCYERALSRDPATGEGTVRIGFIIDPEGHVTSTEVLHDELANADVARCVADRLKTWRFPKPRGGSVQVRYPFVFRQSR